MPIIELKELTRDFEYYEKTAGLKGSLKNLFAREKIIRRAVSGVSFTIEAGEIVGFIGPNGAGKSTTLKMLSGILYPTSGEAKVNGYVPWERKEVFKRSFALVAGQKSQLWIDLPAIESLRLNKYIYEIPDDIYKSTVGELTEMLGVGDLLNVQVRRLSLGERMKMELIAALLHKPSVFLLDEPTIGLDILSQQAIRGYLKEYNRNTGATILLTSHYTKDIEELCDHTIIINRGKKVYDGSIGGLRKYNSGNKAVILNFREKVDPAVLAGYGYILESEQNKVTLEIPQDKLNGVLPHILASFPIDDFTIENLPLEKVIESIYKEE
ncbi:MAG: ATP-binding cassette domain-containing protein [Oscillospiraceae bacterium]|nr:ATP-binding cassette domain-containing protein [Oscillospiraceae bacterium]